MGQSLGFSNAQKATTTFIPAHSYRLCLGIGAQPENAGFFLTARRTAFHSGSCGCPSSTRMPTALRR